MRQNKFIQALAKRPMECVGLVLALFFIITGLIILWPSFDVTGNSFLANINSVIAVKAMGAWYIGLFTSQFFLLLGQRVKWQKITCYLAFMTFMALTIIRVGSLGFDNIAWPPYAIFAVVQAILYVRLKWGIVEDG